MPTVLLTGGRAPVTLELARAFGRQGWRVLVAESLHPHLSQYSRFVAQTYPVPAPNQRPFAFCAALLDILRREPVQLLIPTCEEVFWVALFHAQLSAHCVVFCEPRTRLKALHSKWEFVQLAQKLGLSVPTTHLLTNPAPIAQLQQAYSPLVYKPEYSRFAEQTHIAPPLPPAIFPSPQARWVAQTFVAGRTLCTYSIAWRGKLLAHACYPTVWQAGKGAAVYFRALQRPATRRWVETLVSQLGLSGQFAFDFIERADGTCLAIECNPRATSGLHLLASQAGLVRCFAEPDACQTCIEPAPAEPPAQLALAMWVYALPQALRQGKLSAWWQDWRQGRDVVGAVGDHAPLWGQLLSTAKLVQRARQAHISPTAASTVDIEWNGED
ncbi:MAG TPA: hypothetical protein PK299_00970 [Anaerolineales bacterium]|nr:hypothetical protein [Anaerolineales bacterium]